MIKTKKSKNTRIGLILCSLFICLCSILCIVPFKQEKLIVSADSYSDTDVVFNSSNFFVPYDFFNLSINSTGGISRSNIVSFYDEISNYTSSYEADWLKFYMFNITLKSINNELYCSIPFYFSSSVGHRMFIAKSSSIWVESPSYFNNEPTLFKVSDFTGQVYIFNDSNVNFNDNGILEFDGSVRGLTCWINFGSNFDYTSIYKVSISYDVNTSGTLYSFLISYFDKNDVRLSFSFYTGTKVFDFNSRSYYLSPPNLTDNQYYQEGYTAGETSGYNNGYNVGQTDGYNNGYNIGQNVGYNNGYTAGSEDSNQYTFLNLLSATIDAPIQYFQSLFNFELLGVNLQGFLTGLFTLCVIVTIVKLCLGG